MASHLFLKFQIFSGGSGRGLFLFCGWSRESPAPDTGLHNPPGDGRTADRGRNTRKPVHDHAENSQNRPGKVRKMHKIRTFMYSCIHVCNQLWSCRMIRAFSMCIHVYSYTCVQILRWQVVSLDTSHLSAAPIQRNTSKIAVFRTECSGV